MRGIQPNLQHGHFLRQIRQFVLDILDHFRFSIKMIDPGILPPTPLLDIRQRRAYIPFWRPSIRGCIGNVLPLLHLQVEAEFIRGMAFPKLFFVAWIIKRLPKVRDGVDGVSAEEGCGKGVRMVKITANHFDAPRCERLGSGLKRIAGEAADAPIGLVDEDIGYRGALTELMSQWTLDLSHINVYKILGKWRYT